MPDKGEMVFCTKCGQVDTFLEGALTDKQKDGYICANCRESVLELEVQKANRKNGDILLG